MSISILVADSLHINKKNFASFFKFVEQTKPKIDFENTQKDWWTLYGNYESKLDKLYEKIDTLSKLPIDALYKFSMHDISLFLVCRAELLSLVAVLSDWYDEAYPTDSYSLFLKLYEKNRTALLQNMAAAWHWLNFWNQKLAESQQYQYCCVFSGSLIYQRSLIELLKFKPTRVMVMESLFTGNEFFCEERYSPIANRTDIMHKAVYQSLLDKINSESVYENERMKAINKMILMKNKNVQQPTDSAAFVFKYKKPVVTIIGQVVNDFSLLEVNGLGISSVQVYKELITKLVKAGFNVVLKTHPWEKQKINIKSSLTKEIIQKFVDGLSVKEREHIKIVGDYSIKKLFEQSEYVISLNSQGLIEAAFEGFKPIQLGNAFYGKKGFTHDYTFTQLTELISDIKSGKLNNLLTLPEFDCLEQFLTVLLQKHTISVFDSGLPLLRKRFELPKTIALAEAKKEVPAVSAVATEKVKPVETKKAVNAVVVVDKALEKDTVAVKGNQDNEENPKLTILPPEAKTSRQKKWQKFKADPRLFFAQSQYSILRPLKHFFTSKQQ
ncbi:capsule biosynthesis protein [Kingella kingae]|uniref:capsular polysaccharide export protein, LipB/KpsS family n=1 Tax=Kingella kingae TaxID=504 RepID=UPI00254D2A01|nr:capsule biosynthesis protein [Kingella kingae]MDK4574071.1 capsule biosynthesis protein [Kingella kingae]MDK4577181.1 capsule biosynthesis protein [Kingella kingae]MDK4581998.1 capsule biosynthesis protein [Kingella kingae]MDK4592326.1 capsule biosynthesis protein [Kingella kingae]MDK4594319.1 capsule biosynthesis protein [Kingella kingae]